jgi:hypothetical protein
VAFNLPDTRFPEGLLHQFTQLNDIFIPLAHLHFHLEGGFRHRHFGEAIPPNRPADYNEKVYAAEVLSLLQKADTLLDSWGEVPLGRLDED